MPRTILYTGKGGVGKTSVATATARACAASGLRTIVVSTDPAHSLGDSLQLELGDRPREVGAGLWALEVSSQAELERRWDAVRTWLAELVAEAGVQGIAAEELTVPPGLDELFSLLEIRRLHAAAEFDVIIVDCAPTGETLRLLSFPEVCRWWLERVVPWERRLLGAARPIVRGMLDMPMPSEDALAQVQGIVRDLVEMNSVLRDRRSTSIRLVMNPDRMVVREARRTFTYLSLYGYLTDAVIVNRIFPAELAGSYFSEWRERQAEVLEEVRAGFSPVPLLTATYHDQEVIGPGPLDRLAAELFADADPAAVLHDAPPHTLAEEDGRTVLRMRVPFTERSEIRLQRVGDELIVSAGELRRTIILPAALASRRPSGAALADGVLKVSFDDGNAPTPDRAQPPTESSADPERRTGAAQRV